MRSLDDGVDEMEEKKISTKLLLKSSFWYTVSNFLTRAMVFITMPFFTRLFTKEQYGDFSVFASWQTILLIICGIENYSTLNRARFDFTGEGEIDGYITSSLVLSTLLTSIIFVLYLIYPTMFDRLFLMERKYMFMMFLYLFTYPVFAMFQAKQRVEYKYKLNSAISFSVSILSALLSIFLAISMTSDRLLGRIVGQYILYIIVGMLFYIYFICRSRSVTLSAWKYALRMGLPLVFSFLGSQILLSSDSLVLKHMCSAEEVSYLSVTHSCSHIMLLLVQTLNTAWAPWFYDMLKVENDNAIRKTFIIYLWIIIIGTGGIVLLGPEIILILGGKGYRESMYLLPAYILGGVFTVLTAQFTNLETYHKRPEYSAILTATVAVLNIVLDVVGVKMWGYRAVVYATLLCQLVLIGLHYLVSLKMGIRKLLPIKYLAFALIFSLALIPSALLLYESGCARYVFVGILIIACLIFAGAKRNEIKVLVCKFIKSE